MDTNIFDVKKINISEINKLGTDSFTRKILLSGKEGERLYEITMFADDEKDLEIEVTKKDIL